MAVRDFGRGIPLGKVVDCVSKINTGAKYNDEVFQFSVGLNGVGTKAVNALSKVFLVRSHRDGEFAEASFKQGKLKKEDNGKTKEPNGTFIEFEQDPDIFKESEFRLEHIERRLRHYSYLNSGLKLILNVAGQPEPKVFQSRLGLMDLVLEDLRSRRRRTALSPAPLHEQDAGILFHAQQQPLRRDVLFLRQRPIHQRRRHALERVSRRPAQSRQRIRQRANTKATTSAKRMIGAVAIRLKDPVFESQTKNKLGNTEIRTELVNNVREELLHFFNRNKEIAEKIMSKAEDTRQLRKELQEVKKLARERAKAITIRIPQLKDCKNHLDKKREQRPGHAGFHLRRSIRRRLHHELPRRHVDPAALDRIVEAFETRIGPRNGAQIVARAWSDPEFKQGLLADATAAANSLGHVDRVGSHLIAVENTPDTHNLVVCTLCSCYPWEVLGLPPIWYKSAPYRSRAVIDPRGVLGEFGVTLPIETEIRIWDSTAETRFIVIPMRPPAPRDGPRRDLPIS